MPQFFFIKLQAKTCVDTQTCIITLLSTHIVTDRQTHKFVYIVFHIARSLVSLDYFDIHVGTPFFFILFHFTKQEEDECTQKETTNRVLSVFLRIYVQHTTTRKALFLRFFSILTKIWLGNNNTRRFFPYCIKTLSQQIIHD